MALEVLKPRDPTTEVRSEAQTLEKELAPTPIDVPDTIPSTALSSNTTRDDLFRRVTESFEQNQNLQNRILEAASPTEDELDLRRQIRELNTAESRGLSREADRPVAMEFITGRQESIQRNAAIERQALQDQLDSLVEARTAPVDSLTKAMEFNTSNLNLLQSLQELTQPEVLSTQVNELTGDVFTLVQDPQTGGVTTRLVGNIGVEKAGKAYVSTGTFDTKDGKRFYGVTPEGQIEVTDLPGSVGEDTEGDLSKAIIDIRTSIRQEPSFKSFNEVLNGYQNVKVGVRQRNAAGDLAIVNGIAKLLDPTGVVRPEEFRTVEEAQGWLERATNIPLKISEGRIANEEAIRRFETLAEELIAEKGSPLLQQLQSVYSPVAQGFGADLGEVVPEIAQLQTLITESVMSQTIDDLLDQYPNATDEELRILAEEALSFNTVAPDTNTGNRPQRNNNPLNIKASSFTQSFPGVMGVEEKQAEDGGNFLVFKTPEDGFNAARRLIKSENYKNLDVDAALKRWSGGGYGAEIAPQFKGRTINSLSAEELNTLLEIMAQREGFFA